MKNREKKKYSLSGCLKLFVFTSVCILLFGVSPGSIIARVYEVGPEKNFAEIHHVPFDSLGPGDMVKIYYRKNPYNSKIIIRRSGSREKPIKIIGIPQKGSFPVIDGALAIQSQTDESEQSGRWLIKVGDKTPGDNVWIKNLHLRNANNSKGFIEQRKVHPYEENAAGVFVKYGRNVLITQCIIQSCGNGVQTSYAPNVSHVTINNCRFFNNGNFLKPASAFQHNAYLCGTNTKVEFSWFGEPHSNGNNIKDRGVNTVIRYSWIEGAKNRQIDLVDHEGYDKADAYVYGNVIIQGKKINNYNMIHWGGDSGVSRSGTLFFFNNTVVGKSQTTRYFVTRYSDCKLWLANNVFTGSGQLWNNKGGLNGSNNWFSNSLMIPPYMGLGEKGSFPGFVLSQGIPYMPGIASPLVNKGTYRLPVKVFYVPSPGGGGKKRPVDRQIDIGAYEYRLPSQLYQNKAVK